jgi:hypothetical protein
MVRMRLSIAGLVFHVASSSCFTLLLHLQAMSWRNSDIKVTTGLLAGAEIFLFVTAFAELTMQWILHYILMIFNSYSLCFTDFLIYEIRLQNKREMNKT